MSAGGKADHLWPPTGKYKEEGEKSLLEAAKTLACARVWHEGGEFSFTTALPDARVSGYRLNSG